MRKPMRSRRAANPILANRFALESLEDRSVPSASPLGAEFRVNQTVADHQQTWNVSPQGIICDPVGNFIVTWSSKDQDGDDYGVYARRYNAAGVAQGNEFRVNTHTTGKQWFSTLAVDADGDFLVVWASQNQDGSSYGVYGQRYSAAGVAQGSEFRVNSLTTAYQSVPAAAMNANGDFVVAWSSANPTGAGPGIYARRFDAAGNPLGGDFKVSSYSTGIEDHASVAMDAAGNFIITWSSLGPEGGDFGVYGRRYNSTGVAQGNEFLINAYTTHNQTFARVAVDGNGDFAIAWMSYGQDGAGYGIYARRYAANGTPLASEFRVNTTTTNYQRYPNIALDAAGDFVVTWMSYAQDGSGYGIYAQRYTSTGTADGSEFKVNTYTTNFQIFPTIGMNAAGDFVVAWSSYFQDTSRYGVFAQRYNLGNSLPVALPGGPYATQEGAGVNLDASLSYDPDGGPLASYSWDINGDDLFGDASGATPFLTWAQLVALGIGDSGVYAVKVRVDDGEGGIVTSAASSLTVQNIAPTVALSIPALGLRPGGAAGNAVRGQPGFYTLLATDPAPDDQAASFTFSIDWDGNGVADETVIAPSGTEVTHVFSAAGTYNAGVTAIDKDGGTSALLTEAIKIVDWDKQVDPLDNSKTNLVWGGTNGFDAFAFLPNSVFIQALNNQFFVSPQVVVTGTVNGKLIAYGQGSGDLLLADVLSQPVELYGGDGDDVVIGGRGADFVDGGDGRDIVFGGTLESDASDTLLGGAGDDFIVGHFGTDWIFAGDGEDLIVGGRLFFLDLPAAVFGLQAEWVSGRPYVDRVANLLGTGSGPGFNGNTFLVPGSTVVDDGAVDIVFGDTGRDWFLLDSAEDALIDWDSPLEILTNVH